MSIRTLDDRITSARQMVERAERHFQRPATGSRTHPERSRPKGSQAGLSRLAREVKSLVDGFVRQPRALKDLWYLFCNAAVAGLFDDYEAKGAELRDRFDALLDLMARVLRVARKLAKEGCAVGSLDALAQAIDDLAEMRKWYFVHWPLPLDELRAEVRNAEAEAKLARLSLSKDRLLTLADKHPPPQAWFDEGNEE